MRAGIQASTSQELVTASVIGFMFTILANVYLFAVNPSVIRPYPEPWPSKAVVDKSPSRGAAALRHSCSGVKKGDTRKIAVRWQGRGRSTNRIFLSYLSDLSRESRLLAQGKLSTVGERCYRLHCLRW